MYTRWTLRVQSPLRIKYLKVNTAERCGPRFTQYMSFWSMNIVMVDMSREKKKNIYTGETSRQKRFSKCVKAFALLTLAVWSKDDGNFLNTVYAQAEHQLQ